MEKRTEDWTCAELSQWLLENGVNDRVCETFEGKENYNKLNFQCVLLLDEMVDGAAFVELTDDDVKNMIKPLGQVKRVVRLIKSKTNSEVTNSEVSMHVF